MMKKFGFWFTLFVLVTLTLGIYASHRNSPEGVGYAWGLATALFVVYLARAIAKSPRFRKASNGPGISAAQAARARIGYGKIAS
jgi:hypothetical protein